MRPSALVVQAAAVPAADVLHLLDANTRTRLPSTNRDAAASAHALLRLVLSELTGYAPQQHRIDRSCPTCGSADHGRPVLRNAGVHVSLARTRTAVAVAVSPDAPVGVDVEHVARTRFDGFCTVTLGPRETASDDRQRARAWTRKEAVLKARGTGLSVDPRSVDVRSGRTGDARVVDVPTGPGLAAAVAVIASRRPALRTQARDLSR